MAAGSQGGGAAGRSFIFISGYLRQRGRCGGVGVRGKVKRWLATPAVLCYRCSGSGNYEIRLNVSSSRNGKGGVNVCVPWGRCCWMYSGQRSKGWWRWHCLVHRPGAAGTWESHPRSETGVGGGADDGSLGWVNAWGVMAVMWLPMTPCSVIGVMIQEAHERREVKKEDRWRRGHGWRGGNDGLGKYYYLHSYLSLFFYLSTNNCV